MNELERPSELGNDDPWLGAEQCTQFRLLVAGTSHEIRNSLQVISGSAELLNGHDLGTSPLQRHTQAIYHETLVLRRLVDDLLDFSRIQAGRIKLVDEPFSSRKLAHSLMESWRAQIEEKHLSCVISVDPEVPEVARGDSLRLRQVLTNLVSNAIKYTESGSVELLVGHRGTDDSGTTVRFEVLDTGSGIPEAQRDQIFEPYGQARLGDQHTGTGLGLTIAVGLVDLMGGSLEMKSGDSGSHFWFDVKLAHARRASDAVAVGLTDTHTGGRVLVVDDSEINRMVLSGQLRRLGYEPVEADGGLAAIAAVKRETFDLVLMDWQMPDIDGLEATRRIRQLPAEIGGLPILAVTASTLSGDRERCIESGMDDFIAKPVSLDELSAGLVRWVSHRRTSQFNATDSGGADGDRRTPDGANLATESEDHTSEQACTFVAETLASLEKELGDRETAQAVVSVFSSQVPAWTEDLTSADVKQVRLTGHTVKTAAKILGFDRLHDAAETVEDSARSAAGVVPGEVEALRIELVSAESAIRQFNIAAENAE